MAAHRKARRDLDRTVDVWWNRVGAWTVAKSAGDLAAALARHDATAFDHDAALLDVTSALHGRLVDEELRRLPLTAAAVPGLGERGVARLPRSEPARGSGPVACLRRLPSTSDQPRDGV